MFHESSVRTRDYSEAAEKTDNRSGTDGIVEGEDGGNLVVITNLVQPGVRGQGYSLAVWGIHPGVPVLPLKILFLLLLSITEENLHG